MLPIEYESLHVIHILFDEIDVGFVSSEMNGTLIGGDDMQYITEKTC